MICIESEDVILIGGLTDIDFDYLKNMSPDVPSRLEAEGIIDSSDMLKDVKSWKEVFKRLQNHLKTDEKKMICFAKILLHYKETVSVGRRMLLNHCKLESHYQFIYLYNYNFQYLIMLKCLYHQHLPEN